MQAQLQVHVVQPNGLSAVDEELLSQGTPAVFLPWQGVWAATTTFGEEDGVEASVVICLPPRPPRPCHP